MDGLGDLLGGLGGLLGHLGDLLGGFWVILGIHGSTFVVLSSTKRGEEIGKIALELRLPTFQSFLKVRKGDWR